jgi:LmbE family N-acetylglucosaminyl deacetylase/uncharacterized OsmC-like protein
MQPRDEMPPGSSVLAVCAHPDDESFGLGAVLARLADAGMRTAVLCFTHGEASTLGTDISVLHEIRAGELAAAAAELDVSLVELLGHPDGALAGVPLETLADEVRKTMVQVGADLLLVFDEGGVTGHPDHRRATEAALAASTAVPVLAWGVPATVATSLNAEFSTAFVGRDGAVFDHALRVDRRRQRRAIACHASQSTDNPVLWHRLEMLGDTEYMRWLRPPTGHQGKSDASPAVVPAPTTRRASMPGTIRVTHVSGDQFEVGVRQHRLRVDQPVADGGEDSAPTPTELFVSSLAACVAHYARRFLARHDLPTTGLAVDATFTMAARPARVGAITLHLELPPGVPEEKRAALLAVASHCTVHNSLEAAPAVTIELVSAHGAAA